MQVFQKASGHGHVESLRAWLQMQEAMTLGALSQRDRFASKMVEAEDRVSSLEQAMLSMETFQTAHGLIMGLVALPISAFPKRSSWVPSGADGRTASERASGRTTGYPSPDGFRERLCAFRAKHGGCKFADRRLEGKPG